MEPLARPASAVHRSMSTVCDPRQPSAAAPTRWGMGTKCGQVLQLVTFGMWRQWNEWDHPLVCRPAHSNVHCVSLISLVSKSRCICRSAWHTTSSWLRSAVVAWYLAQPLQFCFACIRLLRRRYTSRHSRISLIRCTAAPNAGQGLHPNLKTHSGGHAFSECAHSPTERAKG